MVSQKTTITWYNKQTAEVGVSQVAGNKFGETLVAVVKMRIKKMPPKYCGFCMRGGSDDIRASWLKNFRTILWNLSLYLDEFNWRYFGKFKPWLLSWRKVGR